MTNTTFYKDHKALVAVLSVVAAAGITASVYFYIQYKRTDQLLNNPTLAAQNQVNDLLMTVGKLIDLPKDEQPTVATVSDYKKLKDQPFFAHAVNGDKVLIYTKARKAILYDPVANKIVEVAPVNLGANSPTPAQIRIALYNGTTTGGATTAVEQIIKTKVTNATVSIKDKAAKSDYTKILVVDLTGANNDGATQLAGLLKGEVSTLPGGETRPLNADLLVIVGQQ